MIHEIYPNHLNNQYIHDPKIEDKDYILYYINNQVLLKTFDNELAIPQKNDFPEISETTDKTFLFSYNDKRCYLILDTLRNHDSQFVFTDLGFFRTTKQHEIAWMSILGFHLKNWYEHNIFCGKCGTKTRHKKDERALICSKCNTTVYPKISPAIIVAITCKDKILLARNNNFPVNWYALVAGYVDIGESLEETVVREVKEEVGIDVKNIRYYKSQPWPLSGSMMIGFIAEADCHQRIVVDNKEIAEAQWFTRGNLPPHPPSISISGEMIDNFDKGEL